MNTDQGCYRNILHQLPSPAPLPPSSPTSIFLNPQNLPQSSYEYRQPNKVSSSQENMHNWSNSEGIALQCESHQLIKLHQNEDENSQSACDPRLQKFFDFRNKVMPVLNDMILLNMNDDAKFLQGLRLFHCIMDQHWYELTNRLPILKWLRILFPRFALIFLRLNSRRVEDYIVTVTELLLLYTVILKDGIRKIEKNKVWAVVRQQARQFISTIATTLLGRLDSVLNFLMAIPVTTKNHYLNYLWRLVIKFYVRKARYEIRTDGDVVRLYIVWNKLISMGKNIKQMGRFKQEMYKTIGRGRLRMVPLIKDMRQQQKTGRVFQIRNKFTIYQQWYNDHDILEIRLNGPTMIEFPSNKRYAFGVSDPLIESTFKEISPQRPIKICGLSFPVDQEMKLLQEGKYILEQYKFDVAAKSLDRLQPDSDEVIFVVEIIDLANDDDQEIIDLTNDNNQEIIDLTNYDNQDEIAIFSNNTNSSEQNSTNRILFNGCKTLRSRKIDTPRTNIISIEQRADDALLLEFLNSTTKDIDFFDMDIISENRESSVELNTDDISNISEIGKELNQSSDPVTESQKSQSEAVCEGTAIHSKTTNVENLLEPQLECDVIIETTNAEPVNEKSIFHIDCQQFRVSEPSESIATSISTDTEKEGNFKTFQQEVTSVGGNEVDFHHVGEFQNDRVTTENKQENAIEAETLAEKKSINDDEEKDINADSQQVSIDTPLITSATATPRKDLLDNSSLVTLLENSIEPSPCETDKVEELRGGMQCQDEELLSPMTHHSEDTMESTEGIEKQSLDQTFDLIMKNVDDCLNKSNPSSSIQKSTSKTDTEDTPIDAQIPSVHLECDLATEEEIEAENALIDNLYSDKDKCDPVEDAQNQVEFYDVRELQNDQVTTEIMQENAIGNETLPQRKSINNDKADINAHNQKVSIDTPLVTSATISPESHLKDLVDNFPRVTYVTICETDKEEEVRGGTQCQNASVLPDNIVNSISHCRHSTDTIEGNVQVTDKVIMTDNTIEYVSQILNYTKQLRESQPKLAEGPEDWRHNQAASYFEERNRSDLISLENNPISNNESLNLHHTSRGNLNYVIDPLSALNAVRLKDSYSQPINDPAKREIKPFENQIKYPNFNQVMGLSQRNYHYIASVNQQTPLRSPQIPDCLSPTYSSSTKPSSDPLETSSGGFRKACDSAIVHLPPKKRKLTNTTSTASDESYPAQKVMSIAELPLAQVAIPRPKMAAAKKLYPESIANYPTYGNSYLVEGEGLFRGYIDSAGHVAAHNRINVPLQMCSVEDSQVPAINLPNI